MMSVCLGLRGHLALVFCLAGPACIHVHGAPFAEKGNNCAGLTHSELPGSVVGIVARDVQESMRAAGLVGPADALGFTSGLSGYRWFYVRCDAPQAETMFFPVGADGIKRERFTSVCLATPEIITSFGITEPYALVRAEVNAKRGCPASDAFVATTLQRIDGTDEYPFEVVTLVNLAKERFGQRAKERRGATMKTLAKAVIVTISDSHEDLKREQTECTFVTWLPQAERLHVRLCQTITEGRFKVGAGAESLRPGRTPDRERGVRYGTLVGVRSEMTVEFSKDGELVQEGEFLTKQFTEKLPPPPGANRQ